MLTSLPPEIKQRILGNLNERDLASAAQVSRDLREQVSKIRQIKKIPEPQYNRLKEAALHAAFIAGAKRVLKNMGLHLNIKELSSRPPDKSERILLAGPSPITGEQLSKGTLAINSLRRAYSKEEPRFPYQLILVNPGSFSGD